MPSPRVCDAPKQPSDRERALHEVTHLPYKSWCPHCVAGRAQGGKKVPQKTEESAQRIFQRFNMIVSFQLEDKEIVYVMVDM